MSLLERYAREWLRSLEEIEAAVPASLAERDPSDVPCTRCGRDPLELTQLEQNILADLRRVFAPAPAPDMRGGFVKINTGDPGATLED